MTRKAILLSALETFWVPEDVSLIFSYPGRIRNADKYTRVIFHNNKRQNLEVVGSRDVWEGSGVL
jgi:hypothetical protein